MSAEKGVMCGICAIAGSDNRAPKTTAETRRSRSFKKVLLAMRGLGFDGTDRSRPTVYDE